MRLTLPLPPSPNALEKHPMMLHRQKNAYRRECWAAAIKELAAQGLKPLREPPARVRVSAAFFVRNKRDEDNLTGSLKFPLDTLKRDQAGDVRWRQGVADECGLFVDDDPAHVEVLKPTQAIDRKNPRLEIEIEVVDLPAVG